MKTILLCTLGLCVGLPSVTIAQESPDQQQLEARLRRDQQSILRKAERLRDLMTGLRKSYKDQDRQRLVDLLDKGLAHLAEIRLMETVAGVRESLDAGAMSTANQKAEKVIADLESLLQILLDRPSMEKIEEQIDKTKEMEATAAELSERQTKLLADNRETSRRAASAAEKKLAEDLRKLAREQQTEAEENMRQAGTRQPFLEDALRRVQKLQREQAELEKALQRRAENPNQPDPGREQLFDINGIREQTLQQMADRSRQRSLERVRDSARQLEQAAKRKDAAETQIAKDTLRGELSRAQRDQQAEVGKELEAMLKKLEESKDSDLAQAAKEIETGAEAAAKQQQAANNAELDKLSKRAEETAKRFAEDRKNEGQKPGRPEAALEAATENLKEAAKAGKTEDQTQKTLSHLSQALRKLDDARSGVQRRNPSTEDRAGKMALDAAEAARDLRESPGAEKGEQPGEDRKGEKGEKGEDRPATDTPPESEKTPAENRAARRLDQVEQEMRKVAEAMQKNAEARKEGEQPDAGRQQETARKLDEARENLDQAKQALEKELGQNGPSEESRKQAMDRQQELAEQTQAMRDQMKQAQQRGDVSPSQQQAADKAMQQAEKAMQQAQKSMQQNQQTQAARQQQQAAEQLDKARQDMQRNRPLDQEQKEALKEQAKDQKKLAEDIMQLAKLAEKRQNERAQQALDRAAQKAEEAAKELDEGDNEEAEQKQEEARDALKEAQKELEEERERYEDLRQEELLFKIQEELKAFLAKQEPITAKTEEAGELVAKNGRLSRRARRQLNDLGEQEQELSNKAQFLRKALEEEDVLVFSHAIKASEQDLAEVKARLSGSRPQPDTVTIVLQKDVEDRTKQLIAALKREQKRRQEERKEKEKEEKKQEDNPEQSQDNNQNQRQRLVSITAELEMLKQMEQDMLKRTQFMEQLITGRGDAVNEVDLALLERLAHRHNQITEIFLSLKKQVEQMLNPEPPPGEPVPEDKKKDGKEGK